MFVSPSAPTSPVEGTLWFDSDSAQTFIHYDSQWVEIGDIINSTQTINDLTDVTITSVADGDFLRYSSNAAAWINDPVNLATDTVGNYVQSLAAGTGITLTNATAAEGGTPTIAVTANTYDAYGAASAAQAAAIAHANTVSGNAYSNAVTYIDNRVLNDAADVIITSAAANQLLSYNGSAWINTSSPTIPGNLTVSGNISITGVQIDTSSSQANDILKFDGTKYAPVPEGIFTDNILLINNGSSSTPTNNAGIEVERGNSNNVLIRWNESTDVWEFTNDGTTYRELSKTNAQVSATAPSSPYEGQIWFDSSEGGTYVYYGSNWIEVGAAPVDSLLATINAKGDILVGTADNTVNRLAVGSNGQLLAANSATSTGLEWQTPSYASTGKAIAMAIVFGG